MALARNLQRSLARVRPGGYCTKYKVPANASEPSLLERHPNDERREQRARSLPGASTRPCSQLNLRRFVTETAQYTVRIPQTVLKSSRKVDECKPLIPPRWGGRYRRLAPGQPAVTTDTGTRTDTRTPTAMARHLNTRPTAARTPGARCTRCTRAAPPPPPPPVTPC